MKRKPILIGLLATSLSSLLPAMLDSAQAAQPKPASAAQQPDMPIYGSHLMTEQERTEFRARMWAAKSDDERNRIRSEHHEEMKKRALAKGETLPDMPPSMPGGVGPMTGMKHHMNGSAPCAASAPPCAASGPHPGHRHHQRANQPKN